MPGRVRYENAGDQCSPADVCGREGYLAVTLVVAGGMGAQRGAGDSGE